MLRAVSLVGMPGSGKSAVGVLLAEMMGFAHLDTDCYLEAWYGTTLQDIMDQAGLELFIELESAVIMDLQPFSCVVSTGAGVIYSEPAMNKLSDLGPVVFLQAELETIQNRIGRAENQGPARVFGQDMQGLFEERHPLYLRSANLVIEVDHLTPLQCAERIAVSLQSLDR